MTPSCVLFCVSNYNGYEFPRFLDRAAVISDTDPNGSNYSQHCVYELILGSTPDFHNRAGNHIFEFSGL